MHLHSHKNEQSPGDHTFYVNDKKSLNKPHETHRYIHTHPYIHTYIYTYIHTYLNLTLTRSQNRTVYHQAELLNNSLSNFVLRTAQYSTDRRIPAEAGLTLTSECLLCKASNIGTSRRLSVESCCITGWARLCILRRQMLHLHVLCNSTETLITSLSAVLRLDESSTSHIANRRCYPSQDS